MSYPLHKLYEDRPFAAWPDPVDSRRKKHETRERSRDVSIRAIRAAWALLSERMPDLDPDIPF